MYYSLLEAVWSRLEFSSSPVYLICWCLCSSSSIQSKALSIGHHMTLILAHSESLQYLPDHVPERSSLLEWLEKNHFVIVALDSIHREQVGVLG